MLVSLRQLLEHATKRQYALGAFNTINLEMTLGIIRAAVDAQSPVIIAVSETTVAYAGLKPIMHIVETIAKNSAVNVPVALSLDHAKSFRTIAECVHAGFSGIMIDASDLLFDENVILTRQAVDYARKRGVLALGELGNVKTLTEYMVSDNREQWLTKPADAREFASATNVDLLAVAVGNVYGIGASHQEHPPLDLDRIADIHEAIPDVPLVLRGASGLDRDAFSNAIKRGIRVINIVTEIEYAFSARLRETLQRDQNEFDPRNLLEPSIEAVQETVQDKLTAFGSAGQALSFPKRL